VVDEKEMTEELGKASCSARSSPRDFTSTVAALTSFEAARNTVRPTLTVLASRPMRR
jgi:hypothetical protein